MPRRIIAAVAAASLLLLTSCGGTDTTASTVTETMTPTTSAALATTKPTMSLQEINESSFFQVLDQFGVPYTDQDEALLQAQALCQWYETTGKPFEMGAMVIQNSNPGFTAEQAGMFAGAATAGFREEYAP